MVDSNRITRVVEQLKALSAADMKEVARFGKVKNYSKEYIDLKESIRSLISMTNNIHGIDFTHDFNQIEPIIFTGMIPNEMFNQERRRLIAIGEKLADKVLELESGAAIETAPPPEPVAPPASAPAPQPIAPPQPVAANEPVAASAQPAPPKLTIVTRPRIFVTETAETTATSDIKKCLVTADCELIPVKGMKLASANYSPLPVIEQMKACNGALICLMQPAMENDGDKPPEASGGSTIRLAEPSTGPQPAVKAGGLRPLGANMAQLVQNNQKPAARSAPLLNVQDRLVKNALIELGIALSLFPERTFLVVEDAIINHIPPNLLSLVNFRTDGAQLSFEDGQKMVTTFKKENWSEQQGA